MPSSVIAFRLLLIVSVATGVLGSLIDQQFTSLIPATLYKAFKELPPRPDSVQLLSGLLALVTFGGTIGSIIGLYQFRPWSRGLAVFMTLLQLLFYPLSGVWVQSGWASMFLDFSSTLWGGVLAISYVSSLSQRFSPDAPLDH